MKKSETTQIISKLMMLYPNFKLGINIMTGEEVTILEFVNTWHDQIGDMDYDKAVKAAKISADKCKFMPTAADMREAYDAIVEAEKKQIGNFRTYYQYCRNVYPKELPPDYGWKEFLEKVYTAKPEKQEKAASWIYEKMRDRVYSGEEVPEFVEMIKATK